MKTNNRMLILVFLVLATVNGTACVQVKSSLCESRLLKDLPGLVGEYEMRLYDQRTLETQHQKVSVIHLAPGVYEIDGTRVEGCWVNGNYLMQSKSESGFYDIQVVRLLPDAKGFTSTYLAGDVNRLRAADIPFEVIQQPSGGLSRADQFNLKLSPAATETKTVVIHNDSIAPEKLLSVLDSMSLEFTFWRVN